MGYFKVQTLLNIYSDITAWTTKDTITFHVLLAARLMPWWAEFLLVAAQLLSLLFSIWLLLVLDLNVFILCSPYCLMSTIVISRHMVNCCTEAATVILAVVINVVLIHPVFIAPVSHTPVVPKKRPWCFHERTLFHTQRLCLHTCSCDSTQLATNQCARHASLI